LSQNLSPYAMDILTNYWNIETIKYYPDENEDDDDDE